MKSIDAKSRYFRVGNHQPRSQGPLSSYEKVGRERTLGTRLGNHEFPCGLPPIHPSFCIRTPAGFFIILFPCTPFCIYCYIFLSWSCVCSSVTSWPPCIMRVSGIVVAFRVRLVIWINHIMKLFANMFSKIYEDFPTETKVWRIL